MKKFLIGFLIVVFIIICIAIYYNNKSDNKIVNTENNINTNQIATSTIVDQNIDKNTNMQNENKNYSLVTLHTNMGDINIELSKDKPNTTSNFIKLASEKFYDGVKFHRVIKGFMIQAGDPLSKDDSKKSYWGTGGPGYKFNDELTGKETYNIGTVAMANSGPNTNGSQFFIMTSNTSLPPSYTVFGKVISGQDIAQKIESVSTDASDKPISPVIINSVELK